MKPLEATKPWRAFVDGADLTEEFAEMPFAKTGEIRVGVFEVRR